MIKRLLLVLLCGWLLLPIQAQTNKKIRNLQARRTELQNQITQSEKMLRTMKKDVKSQLNDLSVLNGQISERQRYVDMIDKDVKSLSAEIVLVERELAQLQKDIEDKKQKYERSMVYAYKSNHTIQDKLMFIFSADNISQMFRRIRYVREYTTYLKAQGEQIQAKQKLVQQKRADLLAAKGEKSTLLYQGQQERLKLESKRKEQDLLVAELQKKQKGVQREIENKKKQSQSLNAQIDRLVEQEIAAAKKREEERRKREIARREAARKRKEEQERKEAERRLALAEAKKKAEAASTSSKSAPTKTLTTKNTSKRNVSATEPKVAVHTAPKAERMESYDVDSEDRIMSGGFERNKGLMPMPITGSYVVVSHFGSHGVAGLSHVQLDNKGIDIKGQAGAAARAIFDGEVSAVFSYAGVRGVLVRHGNYISVYCNLASVSVRQGQKVKARQTLGSVASSDDGYILHFQLRRESSKLNPEPWLRR